MKEMLRQRESILCRGEPEPYLLAAKEISLDAVPIDPISDEG
jgi:hypothetical protein